MAIFGRRSEKKAAEAEAAAAAEKRAQEPKDGLIAPANIPLDEDGAPISREKVLLFYNPYSGNGLFKNNLDLIIERFQANGFQVTPVRAAKGYPLEKAWEVAIKACRDFLAAHPDYDIEIVFAVLDERIIKVGQGKL